jgi:hypothetical protein
MLIATLALAAAEPAADSVSEPPVENEITVIANKLRDWRGSWKLRKGAITCKTKRSTRDKAIDAIGCDALVQCMTPFIPQWQAIDDADLPLKELKRRVNTLLEDARIGDCVRDTREAGISALIAERRSKRS